MSVKPHSEEALQIRVANYLRVAMPDDIPWTAVESSGRGKRDGARQKAKGVQKNWPDLHFIKPPHGTFVGIELKRPEYKPLGQKKGYQSSGQKDLQHGLEVVGGYYHVARSVYEVEGILRGHGVNLKARAA